MKTSVIIFLTLIEITLIKGLPRQVNINSNDLGIFFKFKFRIYKVVDAILKMMLCNKAKSCLSLDTEHTQWGFKLKIFC